ncbi:MAG TPA: hypothetical protein VF624_10340 [Tepidisphaeraceae bacterium]|jgi:tetratricopeptide (TPR) repeat protein
MKIGCTAVAVYLAVTSLVAAQGQPQGQLFADRKAIDTLYARGADALRLEDSKAAIAHLLDARSLLRPGPADAADMRRIDHALVVAYLRQGRYDQAAPIVSRSIAVRPTLRNEIYNLGVYDLKTKRDVVRSLKLMGDLLAASKAEDEALLILFGSSLDVAVEQKLVGQGTKKLTEYSTLFSTKQKALEATRPGRFLWGGEWIDARQKTTIDSQRKSIETEIAYIEKWSLHPAQSDVVRYEKAVKREKAQMRSEGQWNGVAPSEDDLRRAAARVEDAAKRIRDASAKLPRPDFPKELPPVHPDYLTVAAGPAAPETKPTRIPTLPREPSPPKKPPAPPVEPAPTLMTPGESVVPEVSVEKPPVKRVSRTAVAFAVGPDLLLAPAEAVQNAVVLRLDAADRTDAMIEVVRSDGKFSLVRVRNGQFRFAAVAGAEASGAVSCVGFPKVSLFEPAKQTIAGRAAPATKDGWFVSLADHPRLAGSPLFDAAGQLCGVITAERDDPATRLPAATAGEVRAFLASDLTAAGAGGAADVYQLTVEADGKVD